MWKMVQQKDVRTGVHDDLAQLLPSWSHFASGLLDVYDQKALYGQDDVVGWVMAPQRCPQPNPWLL